MTEPKPQPEANVAAPQDTGAEGPEGLSFEAALAELEEIVEAVSEDRIGIDELGGKVARGAELVRACRRHLDAADIEVTRVTEELAQLGLRESASHRAAGEDGPGADGPGGAGEDGTRSDAAVGEADDEQVGPGDIPF